MSFFLDTNVLYLEKVESTNNYLKERPEFWNKNYFTVYTDHQSQGRGQHGREWFSKSGDDLAFSFIFSCEGETSHLSLLNLYVGLALSKSLSKIIGDRIELKWPNDIQYQNKKLSGILCESMGKVINQLQNTNIIGIGININSISFHPTIQKKAISIKSIIKKKVNIKKILNQVLNEIKIVLDNFTIPMKDDIRHQILAITNSIGSKIKYQENNQEKIGIIMDINCFGELIVKDQNDNIRTINNCHDD